MSYVQTEDTAYLNLLCHYAKNRIIATTPISRRPTDSGQQRTAKRKLTIEQIVRINLDDNRLYARSRAGKKGTKELYRWKRVTTEDDIREFNRITGKNLPIPSGLPAAYKATTIEEDEAAETSTSVKQQRKKQKHVRGSKYDRE